MDQTEDLTRQFYDWERRGRGWQTWDFPVRLEPPFLPFRFDWLPIAPPTVDDGQRPTFLSRLTDRLLGGANGTGNGTAILSIPAQDAPQPEPDDGPAELTELRLSMPPDSEVSAETVEQFLLALPPLSGHTSFEIIGTADAIAVQLSCAAIDQSIVTHQLRAFFPDGVVTRQEGYLERHWQASAGRSVVAECGLADEFMLPLRMIRRFSPDPLIGIGAALSDLASGEVGALQVLFQPVRQPWADSILRAVLDGEGSPFFLDAPEITALAREKVGRPLFACVIRVAGRSASAERAISIARSLGWALGVLANPPSNRLIPLANDGYPDHEHEEDLIQRRTRRSGMILSSLELASLVHPPSSSVELEKLLRECGHTRPAPTITNSQNLVLGHNTHAGRTVDVALSEDQRSRHLYVIGASGTGKSTLLLNLILQDLRSGQGLAVLDPHGDLVDEILRRMPEERLEDVVLVDPGDADYPVGFNILAAHTELERTLLSSDLVSVFRRLSTSWGDQMTSVLGNAILAILESEQGGTFIDLRRFLVEGEFRREFLKGVRDPEVVYFWQKEFPLLSGKPQAPLLTRLDTFLRPKPIRYMVAQKESRLDLRRIMDHGHVLLARLPQGAIGEENAYLLGTLIVSKLHQLAISRQDLAASERRPFYLYVDEFQNFVTPSMESILSGARKYRLGLILAHQDLRQIQSRSADVLNSVLSNPYARVCFRVGDQDARTLAEGFGHFDARDLQSLPTGQAIARVERAEFDFNLATTVLPPIDQADGERRRAEVIARSRARFGKPRAAVEAELGYGGAEPQPVPSIEPATPTSSSRQSTPRPVVPRPPAQTGVVESSTPPSKTGRGGAEHKYLQELVRRWADANDWRATIEESILDGLGHVDVALRRGDVSVACEIAVSSPAEHEFQNIQKCLAAGFTWVVSVGEKRRLGHIRAIAMQRLTTDQCGQLVCATPEELFGLLGDLPSDGTQLPLVRGYRVRVRRAVRTARSPQEAVARVVANAMRRLRSNRKTP